MLKNPNENHENYMHQKNKFQTNSNDPNSKFKTNDLPTFLQNGIVTGGQRFVQRYGPTALNVLVIGY